MGNTYSDENFGWTKEHLDEILKFDNAGDVAKVIRMVVPVVGQTLTNIGQHKAAVGTFGLSFLYDVLAALKKIKEGRMTKRALLTVPALLAIIEKIVGKSDVRGAVWKRLENLASKAARQQDSSDPFYKQLLQTLGFGAVGVSGASLFSMYIDPEDLWAADPAAIGKVLSLMHFINMAYYNEKASDSAVDDIKAKLPFTGGADESFLQKVKAFGARSTDVFGHNVSVQETVAGLVVVGLATALSIAMAKQHDADPKLIAALTAGSVAISVVLGKIMYDRSQTPGTTETAAETAVSILPKTQPPRPRSVSEPTPKTTNYYGGDAFSDSSIVYIVVIVVVLLLIWFYYSEYSRCHCKTGCACRSPPRRVIFLSHNRYT